jgi:Spy/CpxP family protein refolding chaperone
MKKFFAFIVAILAVGFATAQPPMGPPPGMMPPGMGPRGPRKSPQERIAAIAEELKLTPEQAEKFAPVYLNYQGEIRKIHQELKMLMDGYEGKEIDEKLAFRMVMDQLNADADIIACKKEYMRVFKNYLTPEQLSKIFLVEKRAMRPQRPEGGRGPGHGRPQGQQPAM